MSSNPLHRPAERRRAPIPCDQCKRRKVRCDYSEPCRRCQSSDLACSYATVRKKRGPKGSRGVVVDKLRAEGRDDGGTASGRDESMESVTDGGPAAISTWTPESSAAMGPILESNETFRQDSWQDGHSGLIDDSYFSFDDFAQSILASSHWQAAPPLEETSPLSFLPSESFTGISAHQTPSGIAEQISPLSQLATASLAAYTPESTFFETSDLVKRGVELFFSHMYPVYPIIDQITVQKLLDYPDIVREREACLVWSICAMTIMHVDQWPGLASEQRTTAARHFIRKCLHAKIKQDAAEDATFHDVLSALFIGIAYFELKCRKASWFFVREAIALSFAAGLDKSHHDVSIDEHERTRMRRTLAILFITERGACVLDEFPVSLFRTPDLLPVSCLGEDASIAPGLQALYNLFCCLDFNFVNLQNDPTRFASLDKGFPELSALQDHLQHTINLQGVSDIQRADVLITQQWLRLVFWQAALKQGLVSSSSAERAFCYDFPLDIASSLCNIIRSLPPIAIQVHGLGIFEKQFEIAYSLLDALTLSGTANSMEYHENLRYLLLSLSASPSSRQIYVRTLEKKMGTEPGAKYRSLAGVQLLRDDSNSRQVSRRQSIVPTFPGRT